MEDRYHGRCGTPLPRRDGYSPTFEYLSPLLWDSLIRSELVHPEPEIRDSRMDIPTCPGLGIELDEDAVARYRVDNLRTASA